MKQISEPGDYFVTLRNCHWEKSETGYTAVLTGVTGNDEYIDAFLAATGTVIKGGKNKGRKMAEVTMETLMEIGYKDSIDDLNDKNANFNIAYDEYQGHVRLKVKFVNPTQRQAAKEDDVIDFFKNMGVTTPGATEDEIPWT